MPLFDTHLHLDEESFDEDRLDVINRARQAGLVGMVTIGTTAASCAVAVDLARRHDIIHAGVGIQPNYVGEEQPGDWEAIVALADDPVVVGIGETGLDRHWDFTPFDRQVEAFDRHLELSRKTGKPFIVHCREAEEDVIAQLRNAAGAGSLNGIMHSFCGDQHSAEACLELGMMISFAGMVTFKKSEALRAVAATIPRERILVETDAPYLSPVPKRGKRNEPAHVAHTAALLAELRGMTPEEFGLLTTENARRVFRRGVE